MSDPLTINDLEVFETFTADDGLPGFRSRPVTPAEFADIARQEGWVKADDLAAKNAVQVAGAVEWAKAWAKEQGYVKLEGASDE